MNLREYIVLNFDKESYNSSDIKELASKFHCTEGHVMRIFRDMGIKSCAKRSAEIRRDYLLNTWVNKKNAESISELAEKFNCTPTVIRNDLQNLGLSHLLQSNSSILSSTERDNYLLNVWCKQEFPESSYLLGKRFNCSSTTVLRDIHRLGLEAYLGIKDTTPCEVRDDYLLNDWVKQPREQRLNFQEVGKLLNCSAETIRRDVERLGLSEYKLSTSEVSSRRFYNSKEPEILKVLRKFYFEYKAKGRLFYLEEIALACTEGNPSLRVIEEVVHRNNFSKIIKPYNPKVSESERIDYFENYLRRYSYPINSKEMRNLCLRFSAKFSVPYDVIVKEFKLASELFDVLNLANL
jgi:DNA-binding Lrp family transcriptional regulator